MNFYIGNVKAVLKISSLYQGSQSKDTYTLNGEKLTDNEVKTYLEPEFLPKEYRSPVGMGGSSSAGLSARILNTEF
jgi:hypothetical protein